MVSHPFKKIRLRWGELMKLFNVFIRPIIEYCCVIYHPLLTQAQSNEIERMQRQAVKLAYGWDKSYSQLCEEKGILSLKKRRENFIDRFIMKTSISDRFGSVWFPLRDTDVHNIRDRRPYKETKAKTSRYYNSPLSFMRRRANDLCAGNT